MQNPSSVIITSNTWHHYATTWGSQGFHFYIDGTLVYTNGNTYGLSPNTAWWAIGGPSGEGDAFGPGFTGVMDELRISSIQRTFVPANSISNSPAFLTNGLIAYYPFNGNANDASGNGNNGTVYGATLTADRFGNPNSAYYFNGTNNYITAAIPNLPSGAAART